MTHRPSLAEPAFPGDDGQVYPELAEALGDPARVLAVLGSVRLFVPIVAMLGEDHVPGQGDKNAEMAAVLMTGADGRKGLLAFSSLATMARWNPDARPVPVWGQAAAISALDEGADAILLDLASPHFQPIDGDDVRQLAAGRALVRTAAGLAWVESREA